MAMDNKFTYGIEMELQELRTAGDDAWEDLKTGAENVWTEVKTAFNSVASRFK